MVPASVPVYSYTQKKRLSRSHIHTYMCTYKFVSTYHARMHIYIYIYILCTCTHTYSTYIYTIYIYIHAYTHTHIYIYIYMFMTHRDLVICRDVYVHPSFFLLGCLPGCLHTRTAACVHAHSRLRGLHLQIRPENPIPLN